MTHIYILDYSMPQILHATCSDNEDVTEFVESHFNTSNISWMASELPLDIEEWQDEY